MLNKRSQNNNIHNSNINNLRDSKNNSIHNHNNHNSVNKSDNQWDPEFLQQALLNDEPKQWRPVSNLDSFFTKIYNYYVDKGFWCIITAKITNLITLAFTIFFSTFLFLFVNWVSILSCSSSSDTSNDNGNNSDNGQLGVCGKIFSFELFDRRTPSVYESIVLIYFILFFLYWTWTLVSFFYSWHDAVEMSLFYSSSLNVLDEDLQNFEWSDILLKIVKLQHHMKISIVRDLNVLDITNRIMRKENYFIALINLDIFNFSVPIYKCRPPSIQIKNFLSSQSNEYQSIQSNNLTGDLTIQIHPPPFTSKANLLEAHSNSDPLLQTNKHSSYGTNQNNNNNNFISSHPTNQDPIIKDHASLANNLNNANNNSNNPLDPFDRRSETFSDVGCRVGWWPFVVFGRILEWNLQFAVTHSMFDESNFCIRSDFVGPKGVANLRRRFIGLGIINFLLMPFIMTFIVIFFFLKHAEELHSKKTLFGPREWSPYSEWKMREFNELPHFFRRRMLLASEQASLYIGQFPSPLISLIASCTAYVSGAIVGILLFLTLTDSQLLLSDYHVLGRPLLWHLAIFSAILALSRSQIADPNYIRQPATLLSGVIAQTHFLPNHWRGLTHTEKVYREFTWMYRSRAVLFLCEIISVIVSPFLLCFSLPKSADKIVKFIETNTIHINGVGHLCAFANFDLNKFSDPKYSQLINNANNNNNSSQSSDEKHVRGFQRLPNGTRRQVSSHENETEAERERVVNNGGMDISDSEILNRVQCKQGKLEKSFLNFAIHHPYWKADNEGANGGTRFLSKLAGDLLYNQGMNSSLLKSTLMDSHAHINRNNSDNHLSGANTPSTLSRNISQQHFTEDDSNINKIKSDPNSNDLPNKNPSMMENFSSENVRTIENEHQHDQGQGQAQDRSFMLTASDMHLVQSFADLLLAEADNISSSNNISSSILGQSQVNSLLIPNRSHYSLSKSRYGPINITNSNTSLMGINRSIMKREELNASTNLKNNNLFALLESNLDNPDNLPVNDPLHDNNYNNSPNLQHRPIHSHMYDHDDYNSEKLIHSNHINNDSNSHHSNNDNNRFPDDNDGSSLMNENEEEDSFLKAMLNHAHIIPTSASTPASNVPHNQIELELHRL